MVGSLVPVDASDDFDIHELFLGSQFSGGLGQHTSFTVHHWAKRARQ